MRLYIRYIFKKLFATWTDNSISRYTEPICQIHLQIFIFDIRMYEKYQNKYRVPSNRLTGWDYGSQGLYFITICTKDRVNYLGTIVDNQSEEKGATIDLTEIGLVAHENWLKIPEFSPFAELDDFVVMPNHIHGILFINKPHKIGWEANKFGPQKENLASIIRGYKSSVAKHANDYRIDFSWQAKYHDHIIRNEKEYFNIKQYIYDNPSHWLLNGDDGKDEIDFKNHKI